MQIILQQARAAGRASPPPSRPAWPTQMRPPNAVPTVSTKRSP